jgi:hypothetical protein
VIFTGALALASASGVHGGSVTVVVVGPADVVVLPLPLDAVVPFDPGVDVPLEVEPPPLHAPAARAAARTGTHARRLIDEPNIGLIP